MNKKIAPSIMCVDFLELHKYIETFEKNDTGYKNRLLAYEEKITNLSKKNKKMKNTKIRPKKYFRWTDFFCPLRTIIQIYIYRFISKGGRFFVSVHRIFRKSQHCAQSCRSCR